MADRNRIRGGGLDFYTAVIAGIDVSDNATVLTARAYVETAEGTYTYADTQVSSSVAEAASKALASGKYTQYETELNGYLEGVSWTVTVNGATQLVAHGQKAVAPATPTMEGYTFAGWTANGKAFDFATDVITLDTTVEATWTANYQTAFDFEEETVNMDLISYNGTLPDSTFAVSNAQAKTGNQSLLYHNGMDEGNVFIKIRFTDETLSMIDENDGLKLSLFVEKTVSAMTSFNVRIRPYNFNGNFAESGSVWSNNWITHTNGYTNFSEWLTFDENGGFATPSAIMADIKAGGGVAVCIEHHNGEVEGQRAFNLYIDDIEIVKNVENTAAMNFENYAAGTVLAAGTNSYVEGFSMNQHSGNSRMEITAEKALTGEKSLKVVAYDTWYQPNVAFPQELLDSLVVGRTGLRYSVYLDGGANFTTSHSWNDRVTALGTTTYMRGCNYIKESEINESTILPVTDIKGKWVTYEITTQEYLKAIKTAGGMTFYFEKVGGNFTTMLMYIDDIEIFETNVIADFEGYRTTNTSTYNQAVTVQDSITFNRNYGGGWWYNDANRPSHGGDIALGNVVGGTKNPAMLVNFSEETMAAWDKTVTGIRFWMMLVPNENEAGTNVYYNFRLHSQDTTICPVYWDKIATSTWLEVTVTDAAHLAKLKENGLRFGFELKGTTTLNTQYYTVYFDDFEFIRNVELEDKKVVSEDIAAYVAACVPTGAEVSDIVVKNAAGETVALTDGKITAEGEYVITAKIVENGVTKTFTMKVIV